MCRYSCAVPELNIVSKSRRGGLNLADVCGCIYTSQGGIQATALYRWRRAANTYEPQRHGIRIRFKSFVFSKEELFTSTTVLNRATTGRGACGWAGEGEGETDGNNGVGDCTVIDDDNYDGSSAGNVVEGYGR